jgi:hypothetical protein
MYVDAAARQLSARYSTALLLIIQSSSARAVFALSPAAKSSCVMAAPVWSASEKTENFRPR